MRSGLLWSGRGISALLALALAWTVLIVLLVELARAAALIFS